VAVAPSGDQECSKIYMLLVIAISIVCFVWSDRLQNLIWANLFFEISIFFDFFMNFQL
jgi:hypothetical protein